MEIALNFNFLNEYLFLSGSWSLVWTNPPRLRLGYTLTQMSYPKVCQYAKTEILTGVKLGM